MSKTKKRVIRHARTASRSRSFAALLVVAATVMLGAVTLPSIFADTSTPVVNGVAATPGNGDGYTVTVDWTGRTNDHWKGQTIGGGSTQDWTSSDKSIKFSGLTCNVTYTFRVAAAGAGNGAQSDWKSATATPACPVVIWSNFAASGNNVVMSWASTPRFDSTFNLYIKVGSGSYAKSTTKGTSWTISGSCNTTYTVYATASAGGQTGPASAIRSAVTAACPAPPSTGGGSTGGSSSGSGSSTGGSSGSSTSSSSTKSSTTKSSTKTSQTSAPVAPGAPANLSAEVLSSKVVRLSWDADAAADHYVLSRTSDDGATWQQISDHVTGTSYTDEETDFSATYSYRLQAFGPTGLSSPLSTVQASTEAFKASSNQITSDDNLMQVTIPEGAIDGDYSCSISNDETSSSKVPSDKSPLLGPSTLNCVTADGDVINSFKKPVIIVMKLASVVDGYSDITAATYKDGSWKTVTSTYNAQNQQISFKISDDVAFVAFGVKQHSAAGMIIVIVLLLLLIAGALAAYFLWWRRRSGDNYYPIDVPAATPATVVASSPAAVQSQASAEQEFRQALAQPDCSHLNMAQQVVPSGTGCYECEQQGTKWRALRICLICGHVGCSDDSTSQHALKHYQETGHPLIYEYGNPAGNTIGWCYVDQTYI
jgi:hypothetical protein